MGVTVKGLQGMPPPLPGCVWGLPMLPPPVPGLMGAPMMTAPHSMMMPGSHPEACGHMPWPAQSMAGPMQTMGHSVTACASSAPHDMQRTLSAPVVGTSVAVPAASAAGSGGSVPVPNTSQQTPVPAVTPKASGSMATWSHDASAATHLGDLAWADVDVDVFGLGGNDSDLHEFSDSLLQEGELPADEQFCASMYSCGAVDHL